MSCCNPRKEGTPGRHEPPHCRPSLPDLLYSSIIQALTGLAHLGGFNAVKRRLMAARGTHPSLMQVFTFFIPIFWCDRVSWIRKLGS